MRTFEHLLIPTDFSVTAKNAIEHGLALAKELSAKVTFLHSNPTPVPMFTIGTHVNSHAQEALKASKLLLEELVRTSSVKYPNVACSFLYRDEPLLEVIQALCESMTIDLVVMGTKGADGVEEYLVGTNTAMVMEGIACPVLVIPEKAEFHPYKKLLFTTDHQFGDVQALAKLGILSKAYKAPIQVVHISSTPELDDEFMTWLKLLCQQQLPYHNISFQTIRSTNSTLKTLNKLIETEHVDLVAMSSTNKGFLKKLFTGSMTEQMAYHTKIPFMAFDAKKNSNYEI